MLFNSFEFIIFFPLVVAIFFLMQRGADRLRWLFLLGASYYFYMAWQVEYIVLILISTSIDYLASQRIARAPTQRRKRLWLGMSLCTNLGLLFFFKYLAFFTESTNIFLQTVGVPQLPLVEYLLPVGISFYTFQTLSYTIDVYRGDVEPEENIGIFALFVAFFPQLVAGPIERPSSLLPQLRNLVNVRFDYVRVTSGIKLMAWGFFQKLVIADRLALYVDAVYAPQADYVGLPIIVATVFFAFQIYFDFSGYSDIAIGAARVIGVELRDNFNHPYLATSIQDFWGRWHISLSTWFRDYVYIPLGGNRVPRWRWYINIMATFLLSGLWHGANWTFVIWGAVHGGMYVISYWSGRIWQMIRGSTAAKKPSRWLAGVQHCLHIAVTFTVVCFGWIFFRADSFTHALDLIQRIFITDGNWVRLFVILPSNYDFSEVYIGMALVIGVMLAELADEYVVDVPQRINALPLVVRHALYYLLLMGIVTLTIVNTSSQFVYFQF